MMLFVETLLKTLKELFRHRGRLAILVLSPIIFFGFFGFVFGPSAPQDFTTYIGYLNEDTGVYSGDLPASLGVDSGDNLAQTYLEILDENTEVLVDTKYTVVLYEYETEAEMVKDLERLSINAGIILPDDFTEAVEVARERLLTQQGVLINTTVKILGDPSTQSYQAASGVLEQSMTAYLEAFYGIEVLLGEPPQGGYLSMVTSDISAEQESPFEYFIAGFLVFNVILQMMSVAGLIATEREQQTLDRMKMSYIKPWELFSGLLVAQLIAYTLQFVISYLVISFFGFEATGAQWLLAYVVLLISTVFIVGLSLLAVSFVKEANNAMSISAIGSAPLGFLSGAFLPVPEVFVIRSLNLQTWDLIPTYHSTQAIIAVLVEGLPMSDVARNMWFLVIYSILIFVLGVFFYRKRLLRSFE